MHYVACSLLVVHCYCHICIPHKLIRTLFAKLCIVHFIFIGIPQEVLDKLQKLRVKVGSKQSSRATSNDGETSQASNSLKMSPPLLVDVGANLTNFR